MIKNKLFSFILLIVLMLSPYFIYANNGNWGLSFQSEGTPPIANENADYLRKFNAYYLSENKDKVLYLTFDAGYENGYTAQILDTLKKHSVPATFFLVGHYFASAPDLVKRMVEEGHIIGNHTDNHPDMTKLSRDEFVKELSTIEEVYQSITGTEIKKYYRPPSGKYSDRDLELAKELGYKTIFWSLSYQDYDNNNQPTKEQAFKKLIPRVHPGAIILLHNTSKTNAEILDELLTEYTKLGYQFKSLDELENNTISIF